MVLAGIVESIRRAGKFCRKRYMAGMTAVHPEHGMAHGRMYSVRAFPIPACRIWTAKAVLQHAGTGSDGRQTGRSRWQAWHRDIVQAILRRIRHICRAGCRDGNGAVHRHVAIACHIRACVRNGSPDSDNEFQSSWYRIIVVCHTIPCLFQEIIRAAFGRSCMPFVHHKPYHVLAG